MKPLTTAGAAACVALSCAVLLGAQGSQRVSSVRVTEVQGRVHMLAGAGGNITAQIGDDGIVLVDSGDGSRTDSVLAALRELSSRPIQYVINTGPQPEHIGGNVELRRAGATFTGGNATAIGGVGAGATILAHEQALARISGAVRGAAMLPQDGWPTDSFFIDRMDLFVNGEPVELLRQPGATTHGNLIVHFRRSDVIVTGDIFRFDTYPVFDASEGGSISGTLAGLNRIIAIAVPGVLQEGGTLVVPGHGRVGDESDVVEYRDMVTIIRDRVADLVREGKTADEVWAARPSRDYDGRFAVADGALATEAFIRSMVRELAAGGRPVPAR